MDHALEAGADLGQQAVQSGDAHAAQGFVGTATEDIRADATTVPTFADGVRLHRLLDAVRASSETGARIGVA
ncbi:hypothetical protein ACTD5D_18555 [Nocardia takedensis]|uniref:hypothetical protein n=1 Tax=Nocardia takedensis TaxID=259390 RepID=UPI0002F113C1|nr:hypothetical protein [Nocardia takedensis]